jgi:two-component system sensor histidine kinase RegB
MTFLQSTAGGTDRAGAAGPMRLETLVGLRWLAIAGQAGSVLFVDLALKFPTPLAACLGLIGLSALLNLLLIVRLGAGHRLSIGNATGQLLYDTAQLGGLLWLTGGLENPFAILLLAPVSVSATTLPQSSTLLVGAVAALIGSVLSVWHLPLPWNPAPLPFNDVYVVGIWVALLCGIAFVATYTNRVAHEARQLADALTATELALSRQQHLRALDGLAAAAAHELGTPLSTIALAAREMQSDLAEGPLAGTPLAEDIDLIIQQSARCRTILAKLRNLGLEAGEPFSKVSLSELIAEAATPHDGPLKRVVVTAAARQGPEPVLPRPVGLLYGLGNIIENAAAFARRTVTVEAGWDDRKVMVTITDDGPGFPPELMARLGEPYLTTRDGRGDEGGTRGGLGLGVFIAKTLLERTGARLSFLNATPEGSARVVIAWPRGALRSRDEGGQL